MYPGFSALHAWSLETQATCLSERCDASSVKRGRPGTAPGWLSGGSRHLGGPSRRADMTSYTSYTSIDVRIEAFPRMRGTEPSKWGPFTTRLRRHWKPSLGQTTSLWRQPQRNFCSGTGSLGSVDAGIYLDCLGTPSEVAIRDKHNALKQLARKNARGRQVIRSFVMQNSQHPMITAACGCACNTLRIQARICSIAAWLKPTCRPVFSPSRKILLRPTVLLPKWRSTPGKPWTT